MLRRSSVIVADCHRRAVEAAERAARAGNAADRDFWLACERRWLGLAEFNAASERLNDFVESRSSRAPEHRKRADEARPSAEESLRLLNALNRITDPDKLAELLSLAEQMASNSPEFDQLQQRSRPKH